MKIDTSEKWLPIYEALASQVRLKIIKFLAEKPMNIKDLAASLSLSSAIVTMHVKKLELAGIIRCERTVAKGGVQKICSLITDFIEIDFPLKLQSSMLYHEIIVPIGHYTDFQAVPTCGLATNKKVIGYYDDPRYFLDKDRVDASILWMKSGFVEYKIPNYLLSNQTPEELQISFEISSEAPGFNDNWPSDINFFINGINLGYWTSPGDFGGSRGKYTPAWWSSMINQYGLLKVLRISKLGTFIDGKKISDVTLNDIDILQKQWTFKIAVLPDSKNVGGFTLFGKEFGNYNQDIILRLYYS